LIDQSSAEKEHPGLSRDELSGKGLTTKSAESEARKDVAPVETELSSNTLAGHNIESEQLRPVSIDKTFMSEPQTTEEETPAVFDASTSKPVEVVTSPTPDVESPGVVTVDLDGVGVEKEKPEEIVDEGLIEADEVQGTDVSLTQVIESLAFATEDPIPLKKIARIYSETLGVKMPTEKKMREALGKLNEEYTAQGRSYRIKEWAGGVRMASHPQYARFIRALYKDNRPKKLSRTLMETLAIIAYSQPSTKPEVDFVRGVDSDYAVRKLLELGLIDIVGRSDSIGRPLLYGTSERFLEQFGLSGIEALPKLREVEELLGDPAFKKERLQLLALEDMETGGKPTNEESGEEAAAKSEAGADANDAKPALAGNNVAGNNVADSDVAGSSAADNTTAAASVPTDVSESSE
ncbi:MAG: SMC-Scp complex subunit ScpB, partial [Rhodothermales bacterium]